LFQFAIGVANRFGYEVLSLALPVAFMIEHVYVLPFNSKPAALMYETDQYTYADTFKFGITMMVVSWLLMILAGQTWFNVAWHNPTWFVLISLKHIKPKNDRRERKNTQQILG